MFQEENEKLKQVINNLQREKENLYAQNEKFKEKKETLSQKINNLIEENKHLQLKIKTLQEEILKDQFDRWEERSTLWQENFSLREKVLRLRDVLNSNSKCKLCLEKELQVAYKPCGHIYSCKDCTNGLNKICPVCRTGITKIKRVYLA